MRLIRQGLLFVFMVMCLLRAGVQVRRMVAETPQRFHPEIVACGKKPADLEGMMVWQFRNLGASCAKQ